MKMKYEKSKNGSSFNGNIIKMRKDEKSPFLFKSLNGDLICSLNCYAIIPIEEYHKLTGEENEIENDLGLLDDINSDLFSDREPNATVCIDYTGNNEN